MEEKNQCRLTHVLSEHGYKFIRFIVYYVGCQMYDYQSYLVEHCVHESCRRELSDEYVDFRVCLSDS